VSLWWGGCVGYPVKTAPSFDPPCPNSPLSPFFFWTFTPHPFFLWSPYLLSRWGIFFFFPPLYLVLLISTFSANLTSERRALGRLFFLPLSKRLGPQKFWLTAQLTHRVLNNHLPPPFSFRGVWMCPLLYETIDPLACADHFPQARLLPQVFWV